MPSVVDVLEYKDAGARTLFPLVDADDVKGGMRAVANVTARDAIPAGHRAEGMTVYLVSPGRYDRLQADLTTWNEDVFGGDAAAVSTIANLKALTSTAPVTLTDIATGGMFLWDASDLSAKVTSDPTEGVYVAPTADATGASGAWVRFAYLESREARVTWFGALADNLIASSSTNLAAINAASAFLGQSGGGTLFFPFGETGVYRVSGPIVINRDFVGIDGDKNTWIAKGQNRTNLLHVGKFSSQSPAGGMESEVWADATSLAANAARGARTIVLASGGGQNFSVGTRCVIRSEATMPNYSGAKRAEFVYITAISGDTITVSRPLSIGYTTAQLLNVDWLKGFSWRNVRLDGSDVSGTIYDYTTGQNDNNAVRMVGLDSPVIENAGVERNANLAVALNSCFGAQFEKFNCRDLMSNDATNFGYVIAQSGLNEGLQVENSKGIRVRHFNTTVMFQASYGIPRSSVYSDCHAISCHRAGFDSHAAGEGDQYTSCHVVGGLHSGFQVRGDSARMVGCSASETIGAGVYIVNGARGTRIADFSSYNTNSDSDDNSVDWRDRGAIYDDGQGTRIRGADIEQCGGPIIYTTSLATEFSYHGVKGYRPATLTDSRYEGFYLGGDTDTRGEWVDCEAVDDQGNMTVGISTTPNDTADLRITHFQASGFSSSEVSVGDTTSVVEFPLRRSFTPAIDFQNSGDATVTNESQTVTRLEGRHLWARLRFSTNGYTTASGFLKVDGCPISAPADMDVPLTITADDAAYSSGVELQAYLVAGTTQIRFYTVSATGNRTQATTTHFPPSTTFDITISGRIPIQ